ncbi:MAG: C39 family peptidase [Patescibacteria group bacterium]|nr:C39 family peptidase [Patescibacteria group bacterium]
MFYFLRLLLLIIYLFLVSAFSVRAQSPSLAVSPTPLPTPLPTPFPTPPINPHDYQKDLLFSEDFSQQNLGQWQLLRGDWSDWLVENGWLCGQAENNFYQSELIVKPEFWQEQWQHYLYQFDFKITGGVDVNWSWAVEDLDNWYQLHFNDQYLHLTRFRQGEEVLNIFENYSLNLNQIYHVMIYFNHGHIQLWLDDNLILDRHDHRYEDSSGPVSLKVTAGAVCHTQVWFDNLQIFSLEPEIEKELAMLFFKQNDDSWENEEYDQAQDWSENPTIKRWGCALTSLAMIMRYHDLQYLPNGQELNPSTLNTWLKQQADGYLQGGVNWLAGTRLSRVISDQYSINERVLPKLEYQRLTSNELSPPISVIDDNRPAILQIPGHFLVANGYAQGQNDLLILDPAYTYDRFSQHQASLLSTIDLKPSYTDLSYLLLVYPSDLQVDVQSVNGQSLPNQEMSLDMISDSIDGGLGPQDLVAHFVPQPENGHYLLEVKAEQPQFYQVKIYAYDQEAEVRYLSRSGYLNFDQGNEEIIADIEQINFDKQDLSAVEFVPNAATNFDLIYQLLNQAQEGGKIEKSFVWQELSYIAKQAASLDPSQHLAKDRYQQLLLILMAKWQTNIESNTLQQLIQALS